MFQSVIRNRSLIYKLAKRDIEARYKGSAIGTLWAIVNPIIMLCVYSFVFSVVFQAKWGALPGGKGVFAIVLFAGLIIFNFLAECIGRGPSIFLGNVNYVKKVVFPLGCLPISAGLSALFNFMISFIILLVAQLVVFGKVPATALLFPVFFLPIFIIGLALLFLFSSIGVYLRDLSQAVPLIITFLMFLSPIFYPLSAIPVEYRPLMSINPLAFLIENTRELLIMGNMVPVSSFMTLYLSSACLLAFAVYVFKKTKKGFADVI
ncbi:Teichoic acid translocation permease protein TagG [Serratia grimesii]|jgi:lipopolysaccharide transport system permease protein|uniref:ABC transporter permease n=1 Tax=Serratia grimesii TaxID=82995 RepID=UPI00076F3A9F|nr:ABC transporter permease [Serratia grimesii]CUW09729.1 Teichoic acid translocation permease protein TagG [Serratia grimesii]SMZ55951.1 Teichoic acid translocation permease protein TagG [Serratia grimesii]